MDRFELKDAMEQIHISEEMQEEIIKNVQKQMKYRNRKTKYRKKMAASAAAITLAALAIGFPVRAFVENIVRERMENMPTEEVEDIVIMIREQDAYAAQNASVDLNSTDDSGREEGQQTTGLADGFSREYTADEEERSQALWQAYKEGTFPENVIAQVDNAEDAPEGTLCYIRSTGVFCLPDQEMTDEEILEIIDFQHKMSYAVSQTPAAQEARAEMEAERERLREAVQAAGGISAEEAIEIATKQMESDLGERAEGKEILRYQDGSVAVFLLDISGRTTYEHVGDVAYFVNFSNASDHSNYTCIIDAVDGSILRIDTNEPLSEE
ncbi:MAG: hypothetical protein K2J95_05200 [Lachnospiraceae bacterium]|nr:hypothetical protein [Lachnospiraceae bacterium]